MLLDVKQLFILYKGLTFGEALCIIGLKSYNAVKAVNKKVGEMMKKVIYNFLYVFHDEACKAIHARELAERYGVSERELRKWLIEEIDLDPDYEQKVGSGNAGYYIIRDPKELRTKRNRAIRAIIRNAKRVKEYDRLLNIHNQVTLNLQEWEDALNE